MDRSDTKHITNSHDQFFRRVMSDPRLARDFLVAWLPKDLCRRIDFSILELQPRSYINEVRKESN